MDKKEDRSDLFEELFRRAQCSFISDMDCRRGLSDSVKRARIAMAELPLTPYSGAELWDAAHYLYGESMDFDNAAQAEAYFRRKLSESRESTTAE